MTLTEHKSTLRTFGPRATKLLQASLFMPFLVRRHTRRWARRWKSRRHRTMRRRRQRYRGRNCIRMEDSDVSASLCFLPHRCQWLARSPATYNIASLVGAIESCSCSGDVRCSCHPSIDSAVNALPHIHGQSVVWRSPSHQ